MELEDLKPYQRRALVWYAELKGKQSAVSDEVRNAAASSFVHQNTKHQVMKEVLADELRVGDVCRQYDEYLKLQAKTNRLGLTMIKSLIAWVKEVLEAPDRPQKKLPDSL